MRGQSINTWKKHPCKYLSIYQSPTIDFKFTITLYQKLLNIQHTSTTAMTVKYLITGATGGLGSQVLAHLAATVPPSSLAAASSKESNRAQFEARGIAFRVTNFDDPASLEAAFDGVENLFFVSTNTFDNERRARQHRNVIEAAKKVGVKHVSF